MILPRTSFVILGAIFLVGSPLVSRANLSQTGRREPQRESQTGRDASVLPQQDADSSQKDLKVALDGLTEQVKALTAEVKKLRRANERDSSTMELLLSEERLSRLEERLTDAQERKTQLEAREQELLYRMRNISQELLYRGGIRREEAEAAARADLQRALDDVRKQQGVIQNRITDLQSQYDRVRRRVEELERNLKVVEEKPEPK